MMYDPTEADLASAGAARRYRPRRRVASSEPEPIQTALTEEFIGIAVAYANTLLFIGYEVNGLVEIVVYPRYRFSSDDRVQGYLGIVRVPFGTTWDVILTEVEAVYDSANRNYKSAVTLRAGELRAHGSRYETAYDQITEIFRESWHGFALSLRRKGEITKDGVTFAGRPPDPVLVTWRGEKYTLQVFPTGSILLLRGERAEMLRSLGS
jgi:hypothetical protein